VIIAVTSGKGGPGATVLTVNLASELARRGRKCLLVDLDPWGGDVGAYLGPEHLDPRRGLRPLLKLEHDPTPETVEREAQKVGDLRVVLGLMRPEPDVISGRVESLLIAAAGVADVVVVDLGRMSPGSPCIESVSVVTALLLAARPDLQGALAAERALTAIERDALIVATATGRRDGANVIELAEAVGQPVAATFPRLKQQARLSRGRSVRRCVSELGEKIPGLVEPRAAVPQNAQVVLAD
jgi:Mrp family chromosome partitioning ATPase